MINHRYSARRHIEMLQNQPAVPLEARERLLQGLKQRHSQLGIVTVPLQLFNEVPLSGNARFITLLGGAAAVVCSRTRAAALPTD
jgi:hypothetical protein